jgi:hypothetical protein
MTSRKQQKYSNIPNSQENKQHTKTMPTTRRQLQYRKLQNPGK